MQSDVMNDEATAQHLEQILEALPGVPIMLLWDRAPESSFLDLYGYNSIYPMFD